MNKKSTFIGLNDIMMMGAYEWDHYVNWAENEPMEKFYNNNDDVNSNSKIDDNNRCVIMKQSDGKWYSTSCEMRYEYFVIKRDKIDIGLSMGDSKEEFEIELVQSTGEEIDFTYDKDLLVHIIHATSGKYIAMDSAGILYSTLNKGNTETYFYLIVDQTNDKFAIKSYDHSLYLNYDSNTLRGITDYGTQFYNDKPWSYLGKQHMKISVTTKADVDLVPKICSMNVYDFSPERYSYYCSEVYDSNYIPENQLSLESVGLLVIDESEERSERVPVPDGRTRCENESPLQTATCISNFGNSIVISETANILAGWTMLNDLKIEHGKGWINIYKYAGTVDNQRGDAFVVNDQFRVNSFSYMSNTPQFLNYFYYITSLSSYVNFGAQNTKSYVESRNAGITIPVPPKNILTAQWWTSTVEIRTFFEMIYRAKGGFEISTMGYQLGKDHSVGDISDLGDLYFSTFQFIKIPTEVELIVTVNDNEYDSYKYRTPKFEYYDGAIF